MFFNPSNRFSINISGKTFPAIGKFNIARYFIYDYFSNADIEAFKTVLEYNDEITMEQVQLVKDCLNRVAARGGHSGWC